MVSVDMLARNFNNFTDFNYSVHIDPDLRFIYFNNPKCACSTTKASLNLAYAHYCGKTLRWQHGDEIHRRHMNLLLMPSQVGLDKFSALLEDDGVFKFCFMRDPVSRLASAYHSKIAWPSGAFKNFAAAAGRPPGWRPSFVDFVDEISSNAALRDCDEHWRMQARQLCLNAVRYDVIGDFARIERTLSAILVRLFGPAAAIFDVRAHFPGNTSPSTRLIDKTDPDTLRTIRALYAEDDMWYGRVAAAATAA